jgi:tetratricopeptide (TPR) repeat protein
LKTKHLAKQQSRTIEAGAENGLSYVYLQQGKIEWARETAQAALRLARSIDNVLLIANALGNLGAIEGRELNTAAALDHFDEAQTIYVRLRDPGAEASILFGRAEALELAGRFDEARSAIEDALSIVERLRTSADVSDLRASFFASRQDYFDPAPVRLTPG